MVYKAQWELSSGTEAKAQGQGHAEASVGQREAHPYCAAGSHEDPREGCLTRRLEANYMGSETLSFKG